MPTGRVLQFDESRGYGFVAAEDGGDDIFLHVSVFNGYPDMLVPGTLVEYQVMAGERGRKAYDARLADEDYEKNPAPKPPVKPAPVKPIVAQTVPAQAVPSQARPAGTVQTGDEEQMCDVLSEAEFRQELTELLMTAVPELTGLQIARARQSLLEFAKEHGWSDS